MNETMSLLIATAILATGGLGLYMYKSSDDESNDDHESDEVAESDDAGFFGKGGFFSSSSGDAEEEDEEERIRYEPKPKTRGMKTKRNRRSGGTKRRY
jgi:hypothetical protein